MRIRLTSIMVDDQEKGLRFYTDVLGFRKKHDIPVGEYRWITVTSPEGPGDVELALEPNANPAGRTFQEAMFSQGIPLAAFEVADFDDLMTGHELLKIKGRRHEWGIGRHVLGSQIFDYWRDPDGFLVEHFADGDMFDNTLEPGWAPLSASGLYQWGPPPSRDFLGVGSPRATAAELAAMVDALRHDNEFDLSALRGLFNVANS